MRFNINETEDKLNFNSKGNNQEDTPPLMLLISEGSWEITSKKMKARLISSPLSKP